MPHQHGLVERRERKKSKEKNSSLVACHDIKLLPAHANRFFKVNSRKDKNVGQNGSNESQGRRHHPEFYQDGLSNPNKTWGHNTIVKGQ